MALAARAGAAGISWEARFGDVLPVGSADGVASFAARDRDTGRGVLVKVADRTTPRAREALIREAEVLARVGAHPNIHTMFERIDGPGGLALVFERCLGSFADTFPHAATPAQGVVALGVKLAGALETMHRAGYVHAAVDPRNVLLTEWSEPVLANFGSAVPVRGSWGTVDSPSVHTSPEVLLGEELGPATDVYGLASVLYWLVAGRSAIVASGGMAAAAVSASVLCSSIAPILHADVPLDLSDLLVWSLASDPLSRCPSAIWFGEELRRIQKAAGWDRTPLTVGSAEL